MMNVRKYVVAYIPSVLPLFFFSTLTRLILATMEFRHETLGGVSLAKIAFNGFISDIFSIHFFVSLAMVIILLLPQSFSSKTGFKFLFNGIVFVAIYFFLWVGVAEITFWNEFGTRFNFIAVDYLVYTHEVIKNILESYPVLTIAISTLAVAIPLHFIIFPLWHRAFQRIQAPFKTKVRYALVAFIFSASLVFIDHIPQIPLNNGHYQALSQNGIFQIFSAFRNNELNYNQFYKTVEDHKVQTILEAKLISKEQKVEIDSLGRIVKVPIQYSIPNKKRNLILVVVESLGANFIGALGNKEHLTPYLDALSQKALFFTNIYASGTRTVRGLEAIDLSIPPTPGASIVRRPKNEHLMGLGNLLKEVGYDNKFIYGGRGVFDNMNYYFSNNGYNIVDQDNFSNEEIHFKNAWGVSDEDLLNKTLKEADQSYAQGRPFFSFVMTTSNHRPFTYPEGRIDIPSHSGRNGAVKYTDFAIGKFIEAAEKKPWFQNTIIAVVADHSADGRGVVDIPVHTYHIPFWVYNPNLITPQKIDRVAAQIDVGPTLLNLLNIQVPNLFFGKNILTMSKVDERFFCGTYQKVGMYRDGIFTSLGPKKDVTQYQYDVVTRKMESNPVSPLPELENETIAYYQYASKLFHNNLYKIIPADKAKPHLNEKKKSIHPFRHIVGHHS